MYHRSLLFISIIIIVLTSGCGRKSDIEKRVQPITQFSLGSAKFAGFQKPPTAEELIITVEKLYDSFDSVAMTTKNTSQNVKKYSYGADNQAHDIELDLDESVCDTRFVKPDKSLYLDRQKNGYLYDVTNGNTGYSYFQPENTYIALDNPTSKDPHRRIIDLTDILPRNNERIITMLLSEKRLGTTDTYALEMHLKTRKYSGKWVDDKIKTVYLGKDDLLPRKIESVELHLGEDAKIEGLPQNNETQVFLGFVANTKIPGSLFTIKLPKNARPMKSLNQLNN